MIRKKYLITALAIALIAVLGLAVSCSADPVEEPKEELVWATFDKNESRAVESTYTQTVTLKDISSVYWTYTAEKHDNRGKTGETRGTNGELVEFPVKTGTDRKGLDGTIGGFSQGLWNFTVYGYQTYTSGTSTYSTLIYKGTAEDVELSTGTSANPDPIDVAIHLISDTGTGTFAITNTSSFNWLDKNGGAQDNMYLKLVAKKGETEKTEYVSLVSTTGTITGSGDATGTSYTYYIIAGGAGKEFTDMDAGTWTIKCSIVEAAAESGDGTTTYTDAYTYATSPELTVKIYAGQTTKLDAQIIEENFATGSWSGKVVDNVATATVSKTVKADEDTTFTSNLTPAAVSKGSLETTKATTVTVPKTVKEFQPAENETVTATVEVQATPIEAAESAFNIETTSTENEVAVSALDVSAIVTRTKTTATDSSSSSEKVEKFTSNGTDAVAVTIETYITAGLNANNVKITYTYAGGTENAGKTETWDATATSMENLKYPGENAEQTNGVCYYDSASGKIVFTTTHFSTFVVQAVVEAFIEKDGVKSYYSTIAEAVGAAENNSTVTLFKNVKLDSEIALSKSLTLDMNSYKISGDRKIKVGTDVTLTVKNSTADQSSFVDAEAKIGDASSVDGEYVDTLKSAVSKSVSAENGSSTAAKTIKVLKDIDLTETITVSTDNPITLDLGGNTVNGTKLRIFLVKKGSLTVKNGTLKAKTYKSSTSGEEDIGSSVIRLESGDGDTRLVLSSDAKIVGENCYGITAFGQTSNKATIDIYGTIESANPCIGGNGSTSCFNNEVTVNIYSGASLTQDSSNKGWTNTTENNDPVAIYQPGNGVLNIYGGTITSKNGSAVEIRAGKANISGGTLVSEASYMCPNPNSNGPTTAGAAVAVSQHTTKKEISVVISGGTFKAEKQLVVVDPQNNGTDNTKSVKATVKSGVKIDAAKIVGVETGNSSDADKVYYVNCESAKAAGVDSQNIVHYNDGRCEGCQNYYYSSISNFNTNAERADILNKTVTVTVGTVKFTGGDDRLTIGTDALKANGEGSNKSTLIFRDGDITTNTTKHGGIDGNPSIPISMLIPEKSEVTFENIDFHGVVTLGGTFESVTFKNCTFDCTVLGYLYIVNVTFDGCTFENYSNDGSAKGSNPIWLRPASGDYMHTFTFENNKVYGCLPVKLERVGVDQNKEGKEYTPEIKVLDNYFDISYDYAGADTNPNSQWSDNRKMGFMIRLNEDGIIFTLGDGDNTKSDGTTSIYVVDDDQTEFFDTKGIKILNKNGGDQTIEALVFKSTSEKVTLKTVATSV